MTREDSNPVKQVYGILLPVVLILALAIAAASWALWWRSAAESRHEGAGLETKTNSLGMTLMKIPAGSFVMGGDMPGQGPTREVKVGSFYLAAHEVTQAQWYAVMGRNPANFTNPNKPVEQVSWLEAQAFLENLNRREGTNKYRLPSEAEWEYAARAGTSGPFFFGDNSSGAFRYAWVRASANMGTRAVGSLLPNPWGLYDIFGNVWEWVQDCWHDDYSGAPNDGRVWGGGDCSRRVIRGGGWNNELEHLGVAVRGSYESGAVDYSNGFRVAFGP